LNSIPASSPANGSSPDGSSSRSIRTTNFDGSLGEQVEKAGFGLVVAIERGHRSRVARDGLREARAV
jgi:hypothetical protein